MGTAAQIETQLELLLRHPARPRINGRLLEEIGRRIHKRHQTRQNDRYDLCRGKIKHQRFCFPVRLLPVRNRRSPRLQCAVVGRQASLTGSPLLRTSAIVDFTTRTRLFSLSSTSTSASPSFTRVTRPISPPCVTTVSPRRRFSTIARCAFMRCCCGRNSRK